MKTFRERCQISNQIAQVAEDLGYVAAEHAGLSGAIYVTFRAGDVKRALGRPDIGYCGEATSADELGFQLTASVPDALRQALAPLVSA